MGRLSLVSFQTAHLPSVHALYAKTFGAEALARFQSRYAWSQAAGVASHQRAAWVLQDESGAVLGYLGAMPIPLAVRGQRLVAWTTADFMVDPKASFHGLSLMREAVKQCPRQLSVDDMPATVALLKLMKAVPVMQWARWGKPLDLRSLKGRSAWVDAVPDSALRAASHGFRVFDRLRRPSGLPRLVKVPFDERFDRFALAFSQVGGAGVYRDAAYYRWRYGASSPQRGAEAWALLDSNQEISAYTVVTGGPYTCNGFFLELNVAPTVSDPTVAYQSLIVGGVRALRALGSHTAYLYVPEPAPISLEITLKSLSFFKRSHRFTVFSKPDPTDSAEVSSQLLDASKLNVQYGDAEHSYGSAV